jgi:DNA-binding GntR family transcriptional regulator
MDYAQAVSGMTQMEEILRSGAEGRQIAERRLREDITRGTLAPGFRLIEADLSERYGVTRHSARLALDALAVEGLVERIPHRGARVRRVATPEAVEIMECRMVLDGLIARKAAEAATDEGVERLRANQQLMHEAVTDGELLQYSDLIQTHHALVREMAGHQVAGGLVDRLQAQIVRHQYRLSLRVRRAQESLGELDEVVAAIAGRDPDRAEATTRAHLGGVIHTVLDEASGTPDEA